jgi:hypothetical protein
MWSSGNLEWLARIAVCPRASADCKWITLFATQPDVGGRRHQILNDWYADSAESLEIRATFQSDFSRRHF